MLFSQGSKTFLAFLWGIVSFGICYFRKGAKLSPSLVSVCTPLEYVIFAREQNDETAGSTGETPLEYVIFAREQNIEMHMTSCKSEQNII